MSDAWARGRRAGLGASGAGLALVGVLVGAHAAVVGRTTSPGRRASGLSGDLALALAAALGLLAATFVAWSLWPRRGGGRGRSARPRPWWTLPLDLLAGAAAIGLVFLLLKAAPPVHGGAGLALRGPARVTPRAAGHGGGHDLALPLSVGLVALALGGTVASLVRRRLRDVPTASEPVPPEVPVVPAAAEQALGALGGDDDPRAAILRAWRALEAGTVRAGATRVASEAPTEFRDRLVDAGAPAAPAARLADLFELARFSHHDVAPAMRDEAAAALEALRDGGGGPR